MLSEIEIEIEVADLTLVRGAACANKRGRGLYAETKTDVPVIYALYQAMFCFGEQHRLSDQLCIVRCDFSLPLVRLGASGAVFTARWWG